MNFALIGRQLSHSYSQNLFDEHFAGSGHTYSLVEIDDLARRIASV